MSNPYLDRLQAMQNPEIRHREEPSKPLKPSFEGFEGDRTRRVLENHCLVEAADVAMKNSKSATSTHPQNLQNPSTPTEPSGAYHATSIGPDGTGCRVEIIELPQAQRYRKIFGLLQLRPPALVEVARWRQCVGDGIRFLAKWGEQAEALNWSSSDLFGLAPVPATPHPSYRRLSRYDQTGLCWLLQGREVVALTEATASIRNPPKGTGSITVYRKYNKPALGPLGDSLVDLQ